MSSTALGVLALVVGVIGALLAIFGRESIAKVAGTVLLVIGVGLVGAVTFKGHGALRHRSSRSSRQ